MNLNDVTREQFLKAVQSVFKKRGPDYVYVLDGACTYGGPEEGRRTQRCVFGEALIGELGVPYEEISPYEGRSMYDILVNRKAAWGEPFARTMSWVQRLQDDGTPYGEILQTTSPVIAVTVGDVLDPGFWEGK